MGFESCAVAQPVGVGLLYSKNLFLTLTLASASAQIAGLCTDMVICIKYGNMETVLRREINLSFRLDE